MVIVTCKENRNCDCSEDRTKHMNRQLNYSSTSSPYRAGNTVLLCYKTQSFIHVLWYNRCFFWDYYPSLYHQIYQAVASHFLINIQTYFLFITGVLYTQSIASPWCVRHNSSSSLYSFLHPLVTPQCSAKHPLLRRPLLLRTIADHISQPYHKKGNITLLE